MRNALALDQRCVLAGGVAATAPLLEREHQDDFGAAIFAASWVPHGCEHGARRHEKLKGN
jgi:hypothetical protein